MHHYLLSAIAGTTMFIAFDIAMAQQFGSLPEPGDTAVEAELDTVDGLNLGAPADPLTRGAASEPTDLNDAQPPLQETRLEPEPPMPNDELLELDRPAKRPTPSFGNTSVTVSYPYRQKRLVRNSNGKETPVFETRIVTSSYPLNQDLDALELDPEAKRRVVLAITAGRHAVLLKNLREADGKQAKEQALANLRDNYTEHYAIETWWRTKRLTELEEQLLKLRTELKQRADAQDKYVEAAMTIASMHADGIAIEPPVPSSQNYNSAITGTITQQTGLIDSSGATYQSAPAMAPLPAPNYAPMNPSPVRTVPSLSNGNSNLSAPRLEGASNSSTNPASSSFQSQDYDRQPDSIPSGVRGS